MAETNIMTGYTYILVIVFFQLLLGISCTVVWARDLANSGVAMPLQIQCHAHKSITSSCMLTLPDQSNIASYTLTSECISKNAFKILLLTDLHPPIMTHYWIVQRKVKVNFSFFRVARVIYSVIWNSWLLKFDIICIIISFVVSFYKVIKTNIMKSRWLSWVQSVKKIPLIQIIRI